MYKLKQLFKESESVAEYAIGYGRRVAELLENLDATAVKNVVDVIERASVENRTIFVTGNGGAAAAASHFVNDLGPNSLVPDQPGFRVFSLTDNAASVTAIANDVGYESIFAYQLQSVMQKGDVVIAMSVSGNSENIIRGVEYANQHGGYTIGWTGFEGGRLTRVCDICIRIPTTRDEYGPVEDMFSILGHIISGYLTMKRGRNLHH